MVKFKICHFWIPGNFSEIVVKHLDHISAASGLEPTPQRIVSHPDFRMVVLANRPGFPFLGNDFFGAMGMFRWLVFCPDYRTCSYKCTVKQFSSLLTNYKQCTFIYFFTKTDVVGMHLNCLDMSRQFKWVPTTYDFIIKVGKYCLSIIKYASHEVLCWSYFKGYRYKEDILLQVFLAKLENT